MRLILIIGVSLCKQRTKLVSKNDGAPRGIYPHYLSCLGVMFESTSVALFQYNWCSVVQDEWHFFGNMLRIIQDLLVPLKSQIVDKLNPMAGEELHVFNPSGTNKVNIRYLVSFFNVRLMPMGHRIECTTYSWSSPCKTNLIYILLNAYLECTI